MKALNDFQIFVGELQGERQVPDVHVLLGVQVRHHGRDETRRSVQVGVPCNGVGGQATTV